MLLNPAATPRNILQVWFSTVLESDTLTLLMEACQESLELAPDACELEILRWMKAKTLTCSEVIKDRAEFIYKTEYNLLNLLTQERDRAEYGDYIHNGVMFVTDRQAKGLVGNPTFMRPDANKTIEEELKEKIGMTRQELVRHHRTRENVFMALDTECFRLGSQSRRFIKAFLSFLSIF